MVTLRNYTKNGSNSPTVTMKELESDDGVLFFSYSTPVALLKLGEGFFKTDTYHSVTTSKHINQWLRDRGQDPKKVPEISQDELNGIISLKVPGLKLE